MTSNRVYGEPLDTADGLAECRHERGTQFAPDAVDALDRLRALGALTTADVGVVASD
jgi:HD-GYP domain-containing protein (c-di-GMP phosphodiesterase class II)